MTLTAVRPEIAEELEAADIVRKDAEAAYIALLSSLVDLKTLSGGRHGYDFQVEIPADRTHVVTQQIVDLEYDIVDRYAVHFRTYAIAV